MYERLGASINSKLWLRELLLKTKEATIKSGIDLEVADKKIFRALISEKYLGCLVKKRKKYIVKNS
jgi:hypothetical protein